MTILNIENVSFTYYSAQSKIIDNLSFSMNKGEIVGILGPSGRGKSTLLRLIAGLESPMEGSIAISGKTVVDASTFVPPETRGVGMVFQDYALFPHLNVNKNIDFGLHRLSSSQRFKRLQEMVELVQLKGLEKRYPHELSGGQQQRVALARALAPKPMLLLMDEPFSNLDTGLKESIRNELRNILRKAEMTCLFVTHDQRDVEAICDHVLTMA
ncbi:ABC transporter ATP-binding protein [Paenibacillus alginolyticus]|uniref:ABC transporter ATP-binding protein n=1 Tax=Paenibacillus alginolyticus TaxID=59839 RepID=A0ABT4GNR2_9BACL|nr:ABC transporter ATP-binding protein [Paenibacillus alginolyticus]MCY9697860.1 ABC transporter ATP-binding protein [Paenibacillus alginolyticus]MEC0147735.1 ABC transporter ATP-binding protein [Paenibacillus alginolyticus]